MTDQILENPLAKKHGIRILYEDNHLLVVEKPVNIPVQGDASGDKDLATICKGYLKEAGNKPGEAYLGIVHRLDRPVGGVMVFAKTSKAADRLTSQFKGHSTRKHYVAIVQGEAEASAYLEDYLVKNEATNTSRVATAQEDGAKLAKLSYETIGRKDGFSLVDVSLYTGRPHQIRVQLSHAGLPIYGDQRYHPEAIRAEKEGTGYHRTQICLWAYALTIDHPTLGEQMTFYSVPDGQNWNMFPVQMEMLPAFRVCRGVYVDDDIIVCDKNQGVEVEEELLSELSSLYREVYAVHRLDANTTGLVVFARNQQMQEKLEEIFYTHDIKKVYQTVVIGKPEKNSDHLVHYAKKDSEKSYVSLCRKEDPEAQRMELEYRVLKTEQGCSLVEINLLTGRTHQIRVQMSAIGCPVLGDDKYGNRDENKARHCRTQQLVCKHMELLEKSFDSYREVEIPKI